MTKKKHGNHKKSSASNPTQTTTTTHTSPTIPSNEMTIINTNHHHINDIHIEPPQKLPPPPHEQQHVSSSTSPSSSLSPPSTPTDTIAFTPTIHTPTTTTTTTPTTTTTMMMSGSTPMTPLTPFSPLSPSFHRSLNSSNVTTNSILTRKVASAIAAASTLGENEKLRNSLQYISTFYHHHNDNDGGVGDDNDIMMDHNAMMTRSKKQQQQQNQDDLQSILEKRALENHELLLNEFLKVNDQLTLLDSVVNELNRTCDVIDQRLNRNRDQSAQFLLKIRLLNDSIRETENRQRDSQEFLDRFQLSDDERDVIVGGRVDTVFFATLKKVHDIYTQCTEMLRSEQHRAGLEILEEMSNYQDIAYERLSRWIQNKCKYLAASGFGSSSSNLHHSTNKFFDSDDNLITDPDEVEFIVEEELKCALEALAERPVLLNCCINEIKSARRSSLSQRFIEALKRGTGRHGSRPIEMQLHDPLRYIGDILAWVHQSAASERELIDNILSIQHGGNMVDEAAALKSPTTDHPSAEILKKRASWDASPIHRRHSANFNQSKTRLLFEILNDTFKELMPHLEDCVRQVLKSSSKENLVVYFRVAHVLELYSFTIGKLLGEDSSISTLLIQLKEQSMDKFFQVLEKNVREITQSDDIIIPDDLSPPETIKDIMDKLNEIMSTYNKSVVPEERREEDFNHVLSAVVDPLLTRLEQFYQKQKENAESISSGLLSKKSIRNISDIHVFSINCYFLMQNSLGNFTFTTKKVEQIVNTMDRHVEMFITHQSGSLLSQCGIDEKITLIKSNTGVGVPLSQVSGLERTALAEFIQQFYENLFSLGSQLLAQRQCYQITSARLRVYTQNKIASSLTSAYSLLYKAIHEAANEYEKPEELAYYSPQQVITLLE